MTTATIFDEIETLFERHGDELYGEAVTQREHGLQSAYFAQRSGEDEAMIVSCLLHDIGHMLCEHGEDAAVQGIDDRHEVVSDSWLSERFPAIVSEPARLHVEAKRYLCATDQSYLDELSPASELSLRLQGGPMTDEEVSEFEEHPFFDRAIRLRKYDDMGKEPDMKVPALEHYRTMIESQAK